MPPAQDQRRWTYHHLFGLIAVTGMAFREAIGLQRDDVDLDEGLLTIHRSKFGKSRLVPLHPITRVALRCYAERREAHLGSRCGPHFLWLSAAADCSTNMSTESSGACPVRSCCDVQAIIRGLAFTLSCIVSPSRRLSAGDQGGGKQEAVSRVLSPHVKRVVIANPLQVKAIAHTHVKADKVDAGTLASLHAAGNLDPGRGDGTYAQACGAPLSGCPAPDKSQERGACDPACASDPEMPACRSRQEAWRQLVDPPTGSGGCPVTLPADTPRFAPRSTSRGFRQKSLVDLIRSVDQSADLGRVRPGILEAVDRMPRPRSSETGARYHAKFAPRSRSASMPSGRPTVAKNRCSRYRKAQEMPPRLQNNVSVDRQHKLVETDSRWDSRAADIRAARTQLKHSHISSPSSFRSVKTAIVSPRISKPSSRMNFGMPGSLSHFTKRVSKGSRRLNIHWARLA